MLPRHHRSTTRTLLAFLAMVSLASSRYREAVIAESWGKSKPNGHLGSVRDALKEMMQRLRAWSKANFGHVMTEIEKLHTELADLQLQDADRAATRQKMYQLDELLYREEMLWLQRPRITWLKEGERNRLSSHLS